jgi:hypothetical protein
MSDDIHRLAEILASDVDARAAMIAALSTFRSVARADELADAISAIVTQIKK